jgi:hypothetical protein
VRARSLARPTATTSTRLGRARGANSPPTTSTPITCAKHRPSQTNKKQKKKKKKKAKDEASHHKQTALQQLSPRHASTKKIDRDHVMRER